MSRVREIRDARECSLQEAVRRERQERMTRLISSAETVEQLKPILSELLVLTNGDWKD